MKMKDNKKLEEFLDTKVGELAAKLDRLFIVDDINNILDEEGVPMRF